MNTNATSLTKYHARIISDLRAVRPTARDQRHNPDIDVMAVWRDDIEHSIKCQGLTPEQANEFRAACNA